MAGVYGIFIDSGDFLRCAKSAPPRFRTGTSLKNAAAKCEAAASYHRIRVTRSITNWRLRTRSLELGRRTLVMGVVNITPDSFSDGGFFLDSEKAIAHAIRLMDEGADILDLGAESTRPGSHAGGAEPSVSAEEEQRRLLPVVEGILKALPHAMLSVDTYKAETARAALKAGTEIINDVSGFVWDSGLARVCAEFGAGVVLSHTRGKPEEWHAQPQLHPDALMATVRAGLVASRETATAAGIANEAIVLDPGYGFGKKFGENYTLLARQAELLDLGRPLLAGLSRKSFLGHTLAPLFDGKDAPMNARENASLAAMTAAILNGASIVRVHEVRPAVEAAWIADAIVNADHSS
jgi:dihydropteroate synthase